MSGNPIVKLFKGLWRLVELIGRFVRIVFTLLLVLLLLAVLSETTVTVPDSAALVLAPTGRLVEQLTGDPLDRALRSARGEADDQTLVRHLVTALETAAKDDRIKVAVLQLDRFAGGDMTKLRQVAKALEAFRESGKPLIAVGKSYGQTQYYLAAHADEIYMHPLGQVFFRGFGFYRTYFRSALDKISVDGNVFRTGPNKSMYDPYLRDGMSDEEKVEGREFLDQLWLSYRQDIADARGLSAETIQQLGDDYLVEVTEAAGNEAAVARAAGLVDALWTATEARTHLMQIAGADENGDDYARIDHRDYLAASNLSRLSQERSANEIGVIVAAGTILSGRQAPGNVGDRSMADLLAAARRDDDIKAIVLRVDSGGGSQLASELIMSELERLGATGKPLVVSMGGIAASGGYIISLPAREIWAHPDTVTGSIGVTAMLPTFDRAFAELGLTVDGIGTTRYSDQFRLGRGLSDDMREIIQLSIDSGYERFLGQVAESREMPVEKVRELARGGRIFTGRSALEIGLVDELGTLEEAAASAAVMAGLGQDYRLNYLEAQMGLHDSLLVRLLTVLASVGDWFGIAARDDIVSRTIDEIGEQIGPWIRLNDPRGLYYHCFCRVTF